MPAEIVTSVQCGQYDSVFAVPGSNGKTWTVHANGLSLSCDCPAFKYSKNHSCKHCDYVFRNGCFWNTQWYKGGTNTISPIEVYARVIDERCPNCNGFVMPVRIAV